MKSTYSSAILDLNGTFCEVNSAKRENCDSSAWWFSVFRSSNLNDFNYFEMNLKYNFEQVQTNTESWRKNQNFSTL